MKTVIILETDHLGLAVSDLLNPKEMKLVGMSNSCPETWNVFKDGKNQELKDTINGLPVMPIDLAVSLQPDILVIAAADPEKSHALTLDFKSLGVKEPRKLKGTVLSGTSADDYNDIGKERVVPEERTFEVRDAAVVLPPHSLTLLRLEK